MNTEIQTALISGNILTDVNCLLGIDIYNGAASDEFYLPKNPSP